MDRIKDFLVLGFAALVLVLIVYGVATIGGHKGAGGGGEPVDSDYERTCFATHC